MDSSEESRTRASLEALAQKLSEAARQELGALRTALDQRISASQSSVGDADHSKLLEAISKDLSRAAAEQAEAAATRARADVQKVADAKLAATQAEVRSRLEAEAAANAMLRDGLEETRRQLDESRASMATVEAARAAIDAKYQEMVAHNKKLTDAVAEMQREVDHARQDAASNVAKVEAAKGELQNLKTEQAVLQKQVQALEVARKAVEAQYQESVAGHQRLTETIAAMQRDVDAAKQEASAQATNFDNSQKQLQALAAEQAVILQQRGEANRKLEDATRRLEDETRDRKATAESLEEARETAKLAKAETKACLKATVEHVRVITESFSLLRDGLYAFDSTKAVPDVWRTLVGQLGNTFGRAAIFLVRDNCLEGAESVGVDSKVNVKAISSPLTGDSILTRALREKTLVTLPAGLVGVFGQHTEHAIAAPVFSAGRIVAVVYAEQPLVAGADASRTSGIIAEALACHAGLCAAALQARKEAAEPRQTSKPQPVAAPVATEASAPPAKKPIQFPGPARDAKRVMIRRGTEIVMDGVPGQLVDLSIGGAQVLLTQAVRPNQLVRITLPSDGAQIICKGRIVWAVFEQSRTSLAMYRAGMKFSEADAIAIESFMSAFQETPMARHQERTTSSGVA